MRREYAIGAVLIAVIVVAIVILATRGTHRPGPGESGSTTLMTYSDPATGETFEAAFDAERPPLAPSGRRAEYVYQCPHHDPPHTWTEPTFSPGVKCPECGAIGGPLIRRAPPKGSE